MRISGDSSDHGYENSIGTEYVITFNGCDVSDHCITADEESCYVKLEAIGNDGVPLVRNGRIFTIDAFGDVSISCKYLEPSRIAKFWHFLNKLVTVTA